MFDLEFSLLFVWRLFASPNAVCINKQFLINDRCMFQFNCSSNTNNLMDEENYLFSLSLTLAYWRAFSHNSTIPHKFQNITSVWPFCELVCVCVSVQKPKIITNQNKDKICIMWTQSGLTLFEHAQYYHVSTGNKNKITTLRTLTASWIVVRLKRIDYKGGEMFVSQSLLVFMRIQYRFLFKSH